MYYHCVHSLMLHSPLVVSRAREDNNDSSSQKKRHHWYVSLRAESATFYAGIDCDVTHYADQPLNRSKDVLPPPLG